MADSDGDEEKVKPLIPPPNDHTRQQHQYARRPGGGGGVEWRSVVTSLRNFITADDLVVNPSSSSSSNPLPHRHVTPPQATIPTNTRRSAPQTPPAARPYLKDNMDRRSR